jgi:AbiU2
MTVTTDDVSIFFHYCVYVRSVYMHGRTLFETADQADKDRLTNAAPVFFGDLNKILVEYVILQICKITDPAKDVRGSYNHTIEFFLTESDFATEPAKAQRLAQLHKSMQTIRSKVKPARDKLISHLDRDVLRAGTVLGVAPEHEWERFWRDLDEFVAVLYQKYVSDPPHHILDVIPITDTLMLQEAIRRGTLFDQLASGPDKAISMKCLDMLGFP